MITKDIDLGSSGTVTVREMNIGDIIVAVETLTTVEGFDVKSLKLDIMTVLEHKDMFIKLFESQCDFNTDGITLLTLGVSDVIVIFSSFMEVNKSFLELMVGLEAKVV